MKPEGRATDATGATGWLTPRALALGRSALISLVIAFVPQGVWSALIIVNLRTTPAVPWATALMTLALWFVVRYLSGRPQPWSGPKVKRRPPRANLVSRPVLLWAWLAGALAVVALIGVWITLASILRMPGSVLPDLSAYPWWTAAFAVVTGAAISPLCEQAGFWGYWQVALEREFSGLTAILCTAIVFAVLPHPPGHAPLWPKWLFFFLTGCTFSTMAYLTDSILPGLAVHVLALFTFFTFVWPRDAQRRLFGETGAGAWFWIHIAQAAVFSALAYWAFQRLRRACQPPCPEV
jgi:membrane protease YdiL (CAAX protease family)